MLDFLKISKNCKTNAGCFYNAEYKDTVPPINPDQISTYYKIITSDGMSVAMFIYDTTFTVNAGASCPGPYCKRGGRILVDIDGVKGAHSNSKDLFAFCIDKEYGILPLGGMADSDTATEANLTANCFKRATSTTRSPGLCTSWVIENGNMDYLKVDSSGKCPDGKTILNWATNTTCK